MESIDQGEGGNVPGDPCYRLSPGVRARKEGFGLLLYNSGDTHLTFVRSGNLLDLTREPQGSSMLTVNSQKNDDAKVRRILKKLLEKGLVIET